MKAAIVGCGRMGRAIEEMLAERGHAVAARIGRNDAIGAARGADVAFEFTRPESAAKNVDALLAAGVPTVCGTTGWDPEDAAALAAREGVPFLAAPNFSIGVAVLKRVALEASRWLVGFPEFEPGIVERHHARKADVPSGTARMLAGAIAPYRPGAGAPPIAALRQGGQPGEHEVLFEGPDECLALVHRARSPRIFAGGAVRAAEWIVSTRPRGPVTFDEFFERSRP
jgi:4-hydroxy-tetrahydrodipicolinate reductase